VEGFADERSGKVECEPPMFSTSKIAWPDYRRVSLEIAANLAKTRLLHAEQH